MSPPPAHGLLILGIDPGLSVTGWGLVRKDGNRLVSKGAGAWRPPRSLGIAPRLAWLTERLADCIREHRPSALALEQAFVGRNIQSALRLGEARGAILAVCGRMNLEVHEYPTASVKKAVVGSGRADKTQVNFMLQRLLGLTEPPKPLDASDALALAYTLATDWGFLQVNARGSTSRGRR